MMAIAIVALCALSPVALFAFLVVGVVAAYVRRALYGPGAHPSVSLIVREAWAQLVVIGWTIVRRGRQATGGAGIPVVLVHGLAADGTSMWGYRRELIRRGRPTWSPHLGGMFRPVEQYAVRLARALEGIADSEGDVDVICHSMGGVILRACLSVRPDLGARIRRVVTIASPHTGTAGARGLPFAEARQLLVGAAFLDALPSLRKLLPNALLTTVASAADAVVYPHETCIVEGAVHHGFDDIGHAELLMHPSVVALVVDAIS